MQYNPLDGQRILASISMIRMSRVHQEEAISADGMWHDNGVTFAYQRNN